MDEKQLRQLILASQGRCQMIPPHLKCQHGHFPICTDGKLPEVVKAHIRCRE